MVRPRNILSVFFEVYVTAPGLCAWRLDIYNMFVPVFWLFSKKDGKGKQIFRMRFVGYESFWKNRDGLDVMDLKMNITKHPISFIYYHQLICSLSFLNIFERCWRWWWEAKTPPRKHLKCYDSGMVLHLKITDHPLYGPEYDMYWFKSIGTGDFAKC